jgi:HlyD family secretion protein
VNVDEADVGQVKVGQTARFTVSAWTGRNYPATITRVAYGSTITDNVVTYTTQLQVDNPDLSLRPGMTATATIAATERSNVLLVPNTALGFQPAAAGAASAAPSGGGSIVAQLMPRAPGMNQRKPGSGAAGARAGQPRQVWVLKDGQPAPLPVTVGLSNGRVTEVSGEGLKEGLEVITQQRSTPAK